MRRVLAHADPLLLLLDEDSSRTSAAGDVFVAAFEA